MKSQFPNKIKILDQIFKVTYIERLTDMDETGLKSFYGQTDFHTKQMRIYRPRGFSPSEVWNTIIHECIHVVVETLKVYECEEITMDEVYREKVIHLLATGINTIMIDNGFCFKNVKD